MTDLRSYLADREKQLKAELTHLRESIAPLERELFEVRLAQKALVQNSNEPFQAPLFQHGGDRHVDDEAASVWQTYQEIKARRAANPYFDLTIKELVMKALSEQFDAGATAKQLLEFFENAWGRDDIERTSLSPQLSRLRAEEKIGREGHLWFVRKSKSEARAAADQ